MFFGSFLDLGHKGSADYIIAQGTMTFIRYKERCFGITNKHVIENKHTAQISDLVFQLGPYRHTPFPMPRRPFFMSSESDPDCPYDIAIFLLTEEIVSAILHSHKEFIELEGHATTILEGDQGLVVGFPGHKRAKRNGGIMAHPLNHVVASCRGVSDRQIIFQDEVQQDLSNVDFGGMSGGPIFKLCSPSEYQFIGILSNASNTQGSQAIWLKGFPFGPSLMDYILTTTQPL